MPMEIAPEKVAHVIIRARQYDSKVDAWNTDNEDDSGAEESGVDQGLHDELVGFIDALNDDEQTQLVALCWIGRGTFDPEDFDEAVETAENERVNSVAEYLLGQPLLADYLEEGLDRMGVSIEDAEGDVMQGALDIRRKAHMRVCSGAPFDIVGMADYGEPVSLIPHA